MLQHDFIEEEIKVMTHTFIMVTILYFLYRKMSCSARAHQNIYYNLGHRVSQLRHLDRPTHRPSYAAQPALDPDICIWKVFGVRDCTIIVLW